MPASSAICLSAAYGDLLAAVLALVAIPAVEMTPEQPSPCMDLQPGGDADLNHSNYTGYSLQRRAVIWVRPIWIPAVLGSCTVGDHYITFVILLNTGGGQPGNL